MTELPAQFYYIVGFVIFTQMSGLATLGYLILKATWYLSARFTTLDARDESNKEMAIRAHKRIDDEMSILRNSKA